MTPPETSVIVPNYNGRDILPGCLASIPAGVETVVVDNGSTDGSLEEVCEGFPHVALVRNSANLGFAAAVNRGIERARGRFLVILNSDARLTPGALGILVGCLEAHPDAGIVAPQLLHEDGRPQHSFANFPSLATELLNKSVLRMLFPNAFPSKRQRVAEPRDVPSVIGACMGVRRDVVEKIGGLDPAYFLFLEETEWCWRARRAGYRVVFVPGAAVVHLQGRTRDKVALRARIEYVRSLFLFFRRNRLLSYPILRMLYPVKNLLELVLQGIGAPFGARTRARWVETAATLAWQLAGGPRSWGLSCGAEPPYVPVASEGHFWLAAREEVPLFREFDRRVERVHLVKDLRHKKTVRCVAGPRTFLVKIYKRGTWMRRLKTALWGSRALRELDRCRELVRRGIPTVPMTAAGEYGPESCVVFEELPDWEQLQDVLLSADTEPARRRALLGEYGRFARRLQDVGVWQYDFNPSNVLVRGTDFKAIDLERMAVRDAPISGSTRLYLLAKMDRLQGLSRADRLRFLKGYVSAHREDQEGLQALVVEILRRGRRQAERDAAKAARRCTKENRDFARFEIGETRGYFRKNRFGLKDAGLAFEDLRCLVEARAPNGAYRLEPTEDALGAWKEAHRRAKAEGARAPVAVLLRKGESRGTVVYPAAPRST